MGGFRAELRHFAENGDALALGLEFREGEESSLGRIGIGVVTVVDELDAADFPDLQTRPGKRGGGQTGGAFLERESKNTTRRNREKRVLDHMQTGHGQDRMAVMRAFQNGKLSAARGLDNVACL